jgi:hypothetical protein
VWNELWDNTVALRKHVFAEGCCHEAAKPRRSSARVRISKALSNRYMVQRLLMEEEK